MDKMSNNTSSLVQQLSCKQKSKADGTDACYCQATQYVIGEPYEMEDKAKTSFHRVLINKECML